MGMCDHDRTRHRRVVVRTYMVSFVAAAARLSKYPAQLAFTGGLSSSSMNTTTLGTPNLSFPPVDLALMTAFLDADLYRIFQFVQVWAVFARFSHSSFSQGN